MTMMASISKPASKPLRLAPRSFSFPKSLQL
jgi:hypothetical protein